MKEIIINTGDKTQVDDEDYDLNKFLWYLSSGYATRKDHNEKMIRLHQEIIKKMGKTVPVGCDIDHEDQNKLNNQRSNLRVITKSKNRHNSKMNSKNSSGVKGVRFVKKDNRWRAEIKINDKGIHLGSFIERKEAIKVRRRAERRFFPEIYKERICFLDLDNVLVDLISGLTKKFGIEDPYNDEKLLGVWDFVSHLNLDHIWESCDKDFWANLDPMPDWKEILDIVEYGFFDQIVLVSTPCNHVECMDGKLLWIEKYVPQYKNNWIFTNRKELLAQPNRTLVDDSDNNIYLFQKAGGNICLVPRKCNSLHHKQTIPYMKGVLLG